MYNLPCIKEANTPFSLNLEKRLLIMSDGFESRSVAWLKTLPVKKIFQSSVVFRHFPIRENQYLDQQPEIRKRTIGKLYEEQFNHVSPIDSEFQLIILLDDIIPSYEEIYIDISVMSKLLILQLIEHLKKFSGKVIFIYSQPCEYAPSETDYKKAKANDISKFAKYPTSGVIGVVQTPLLTSLAMQQFPALIIAFTSFNEQLIRAIVSSITASNIYFINGVPPLLTWREKATQEIHSRLISEYRSDNPVDDEGRLIRRTSTLNYQETFEEIRNIYSKNFTKKRIILTPTGSKMQALGCGLMKICCPDIHIEYPTPESFFASGFSSPEIEMIHEVTFENFSKDMLNLKREVELSCVS